MAAAMVPLEVALSSAIGARVQITTAAPTASTLEGTLFTACPITNLVAINTAPSSATTAPNTTTQSHGGDYHIIPISRIQSFQLLALPPTLNGTGVTPSFTDAIPPLHALDTRALRAREAAAVTKLQQQEAKRGKGVTREAQDVFDALSRTMPARWDGPNIIVADAVSIASPYRVDDCRALHVGDTAALNRVRKVLEMERKKIELRNASTAIGNTGTFTRNAGPAAGGGGGGGGGGNAGNVGNAAVAPTTTTSTTTTPAKAAIPVAIPHKLSSSPGPGAAGQRKGG